MYLVTLFDLTATKENPIEPRQVAINSSTQLANFVETSVDSTHSCTIVYVPMHV